MKKKQKGSERIRVGNTSVGRIYTECGSLMSDIDDGGGASNISEKLAFT